MKLITALHPAAAMALSIGGPWSSLEARAEEGPSISQTFKSLADFGLVNGTGCVINDHGASKNARAETGSSCTNQQQQVDAGLAQCVQRAQRAEKAARDGSELFQQYFRTQDSSTRDKVAQFFVTIASNCGRNGDQPVSVDCTPSERCTLEQTGNMELAAIAKNQPRGGGSIQLCRSAFTTQGDGGGNQRRQDQGQCEENLSGLGDLFVHEMSHATVSTRDVVYGKTGCLGLTTDDALINADSYALFAQDVFAGCAAQPGAGKQPPNNGNNPPINGNNPPINGNDPPINGNNPPINGNNPPINGNNPPINGNNPPINGNNPPINGNNPPINGNNPPISCGNERPPNDQSGNDEGYFNNEGGDDGIDQLGGNGIDGFGGDGIDQPGGNGIDGFGGDGIDQLGNNGIDGFGGDGIDQLGGNGIDEFGGDSINQLDIDEDYFNNRGGGDGRFGGDKEYLNN